MTPEQVLDAILQLLGLEGDCVENTVLTLQVKCQNGDWVLQAQELTQAAATRKPCKPCRKKGK